MGQWIQLVKVDELASGQGRAITVGDRTLALFNEDGRFYAIDDTCPHQGASLSTGLLHEGRVICPWHSWVFDLATGRCPRDSHEAVAAYPTRCTHGAVEVRIPVE